MTFNFKTFDGAILSGSFNIIPVNYPGTNNNSILTGDVITSSISPATLVLADDVFKVEYNDQQTSNTWYVQQSSGIVITPLSCSVISASLCNVYFNLADFNLNSLNGRTVKVTPLNSSTVDLNGNYISKESITYTADANGCFTALMLPQVYIVRVQSKIKETVFQILPTGSTCNAKDVMVNGYVKTTSIPPVNNTQVSYTCQASDLRYIQPGQMVSSSISASWAPSQTVDTSSMSVASASYVPNLYPQVAQVTVPSASWVSASAFITTAQTASYVTASNVVGTVLNSRSASYLSGSTAIVNTLSASNMYGNGSVNCNIPNFSSYTIQLHGGNSMMNVVNNDANANTALSWEDGYNNFGMQMTFNAAVFGAGNFVFYNGTVGSEVLRMDMNTNYVGIGATSPQYLLDVNGNIGNSINAGYLFTQDGTNGWVQNNGGNFGVGTSDPQFALDVNGDINFTGNLLQNGSPYVPANAATSSYLQLWDAGLGRYVKLTSNNGILSVS